MMKCSYPLALARHSSYLQSLRWEGLWAQKEVLLKLIALPGCDTSSAFLDMSGGQLGLVGMPFFS